MKTFIYTKSEKNAAYATNVTLDVFRMKSNTPVFLGQVSYSTGSYRGEDHELVNWLVKEKHLPKTCVNSGGYYNRSKMAMGLNEKGIFKIHRV